MLFGRLRLKRSDPESLAASCGRHKVQPAAAAASCGRHKVQPAAAAASCGRHKVRSAACGGVVWSPQSAASDLRRRCVVATKCGLRLAAALCGRNIMLSACAAAVVMTPAWPCFLLSCLLIAPCLLVSLDDWYSPSSSCLLEYYTFIYIYA